LHHIFGCNTQVQTTNFYTLPFRFFSNYLVFKLKISAKLFEIINAIESVAPSVLQEAYDNSGLLVGNASDEVQKALLTLDCTEEVVQEASH
jgi:hypothetical protein